MGEIVTFYSYKGGVGRTMALANVAIVLSQYGYKVLIVDWDLEAPGLDFFFKDYIKDAYAVHQKRGIIDILYNAFKGTSHASPSQCMDDLLIKVTPPNSYVPISLITAGQRSQDYLSKLNELNFEEFYTEKQGAFFIEELRKKWKQDYDFVLIDSRTGVTDIGGICAIQLPDILILLFSATEQSVQGTLEIAQKTIVARQKLPFDRSSLITIPIPSRFDLTEEFKVSQEWLTRFAEQLQDLFATWLPMEIRIREFLEIVKIPYVPYFSFGEKVAVIEQGTLDPMGLGYAYETIAALIARKLKHIELLKYNRDEFVRFAAIPKIEDVVQGVRDEEIYLKREIVLDNIIKQIISVHKHPARLLEWAIDHFIEENGDGRTVERQLISVDEGIVYFRHLLYGLIPSAQTPNLDNISFEAINVNRELPIQIVKADRLPDSIELTLLLDPPVTPEEPFQLQVVVTRKNLWKSLFEIHKDQASLRLKNKVDRLSVRFFLPNTLNEVHIVGSAASGLKITPKPQIINARRALVFKAENVMEQLYTFDLSLKE